MTLLDERKEFDKAFAATGYQYGADEKESVFLGWRLAKAEALQSSEPVAWRIKHQDDDEWDISCDKPITVGNYEVQPIFTYPPSTVTLEEHNKRIAELEAELAKVLDRKYSQGYSDGWKEGREALQANADADRINWLQNNFYACQLDTLDRKTHPGLMGWRFYGKEGSQGDIRKIIDERRKEPEA